MVRHQEAWVWLTGLPHGLLAVHAYLADKGGVGEGGPDVSVLVELVILGQLWGRQREGEAVGWGAHIGVWSVCVCVWGATSLLPRPHLRRWGSRTCRCFSCGQGPRRAKRQSPGQGDAGA